MKDIRVPFKKAELKRLPLYLSYASEADIPVDQNNFRLVISEKTRTAEIRYQQTKIAVFSLESEPDANGEIRVMVSDVIPDDKLTAVKGIISDFKRYSNSFGEIYRAEKRELDKEGTSDFVKITKEVTRKEMAEILMGFNFLDVPYRSETQPHYYKLFAKKHAYTPFSEITKTGRFGTSKMIANVGFRAEVSQIHSHLPEEYLISLFEAAKEEFRKRVNLEVLDEIIRENPAQNFEYQTFVEDITEQRTRFENKKLTKTFDPNNQLRVEFSNGIIEFFLNDVLLDNSYSGNILTNRETRTEDNLFLSANDLNRYDDFVKSQTVILICEILDIPFEKYLVLEENKLLRDLERIDAGYDF